MTKVKRLHTDWRGVASWYGKRVEEWGSYYHETVIKPGVVRLLDARDSELVLDVACGTGWLARELGKEVKYVGVDGAKQLIDLARQKDKNDKHKYVVTDIRREIPGVEDGSVAKVAIVLALQNVDDGALVIENMARKLKHEGRLVVVLNHPCFRIPRMSSWGIDEGKKMEYRRIDKYMSSAEIPISANPGRGRSSAVSWSYHHPLGEYFSWFGKCGLAVTALEEWISPKKSQGKAARMEDRARNEFPLFLAVVAEKR